MLRGDAPNARCQCRREKQREAGGIHCWTIVPQREHESTTAAVTVHGPTAKNAKDTKIREHEDLFFFVTFVSFVPSVCDCRNCRNNCRGVVRCHGAQIEDDAIIEDARDDRCGVATKPLFELLGAQ